MTCTTHAAALPALAQHLPTTAHPPLTPHFHPNSHPTHISLTHILSSTHTTAHPVSSHTFLWLGSLISSDDNMLPRGHKRPRTASGDATDAGGEKRNTSASSSQAQNTDHSTPPSASQPYGSLDGTAGHQDIEGDSMPIENPFPHLDGVDEGPSLGAATMPLTHDGDLDDLALALPLVLLLALPVALVFAPILRATTANVPTSPNTPRTAATVQMRADAGTGAVLTYVPMEVVSAFRCHGEPRSSPF